MTFMKAMALIFMLQCHVSTSFIQPTNPNEHKHAWTLICIVASKLYLLQDLRKKEKTISTTKNQMTVKRRNPERLPAAD